jgi:hypothetical protein
VVDVGVDVEGLAVARDLAMAELEAAEPVDGAQTEVREEDLEIGAAGQLVGCDAPLAFQPIEAAAEGERAEARIAQQELAQGAVGVEVGGPGLEGVEAPPGLELAAPDGGAQAVKAKRGTVPTSCPETAWPSTSSSSRVVVETGPTKTVLVSSTWP